ncbi:hypothetical protein [Fodinicola feengrottensis]|uniref:hypothetical protein n=1 Tax=Fodinicola feengrottensis TaxID=435914 RepID=UPI0024422888|nr:hypothetical protein [Fodinicola feengrottensis]
MVVDPQPHMTYQPFLPEAAAGNISPRHVVAPLRKVLRHSTVVTASVGSASTTPARSPSCSRRWVPYGKSNMTRS